MCIDINNALSLGGISSFLLIYILQLAFVFFTVGIFQVFLVKKVCVVDTNDWIFRFFV